MCAYACIVHANDIISLPSPPIHQGGKVCLQLITSSKRDSSHAGSDYFGCVLREKLIETKISPLVRIELSKTKKTSKQARKVNTF